MTPTEAFANWLATVTSSTLGQDLFIGSAPSSDQAPDNIWWVKSYGGSPQQKLTTGEMLKNYVLQVFYRDRSAQAVEEALYNLEVQINASGGMDLEGFVVVDATVSVFGYDNDLDNEDRKVGLIQVQLVTYKDNNS